MRICHFQKRSALTPRGWLVGARALLPARTTFPLITISAASSDRAPECHLVHSTEQPARQTPLLSLLLRGRKPAPSLTSSATALLSAIGTPLLSTGPLWGQVEPFHIQAPPVTSQVGTSSGSFRRQTGFSLETSAASSCRPHPRSEFQPHCPSYVPEPWALLPPWGSATCPAFPPFPANCHFPDGRVSLGGRVCSFVSGTANV